MNIGGKRDIIDSTGAINPGVSMDLDKLRCSNDDIRYMGLMSEIATTALFSTDEGIRQTAWQGLTTEVEFSKWSKNTDKYMIGLAVMANAYSALGSNVPQKLLVADNFLGFWRKQLSTCISDPPPPQYIGLLRNTEAMINHGNVGRLVIESSLNKTGDTLRKDLQIAHSELTLLSEFGLAATYTHCLEDVNDRYLDLPYEAQKRAGSGVEMFIDDEVNTSTKGSDFLRVNASLDQMRRIVLESKIETVAIRIAEKGISILSRTGNPEIYECLASTYSEIIIYSGFETVRTECWKAFAINEVEGVSLAQRNVLNAQYRRIISDAKEASEAERAANYLGGSLSNARQNGNIENYMASLNDISIVLSSKNISPCIRDLLLSKLKDELGASIETVDFYSTALEGVVDIIVNSGDNTIIEAGLEMLFASAKSSWRDNNSWEYGISSLKALAIACPHLEVRIINELYGYSIQNRGPSIYYKKLLRGILDIYLTNPSKLDEIMAFDFLKAELLVTEDVAYQQVLDLLVSMVPYKYRETSEALINLMDQQLVDQRDILDKNWRVWRSFKEIIIKTEDYDLRRRLWGIIEREKEYLTVYDETGQLYRKLLEEVYVGVIVGAKEESVMEREAVQYLSFEIINRRSHAGLYFFATYALDEIILFSYDERKQNIAFDLFERELHEVVDPFSVKGALTDGLARVIEHSWTVGEPFDIHMRKKAWSMLKDYELRTRYNLELHKEVLFSIENCLVHDIDTLATQAFVREVFTYYQDILAHVRSYKEPYSQTIERVLANLYYFGEDPFLWSIIEDELSQNRSFHENHELLVRKLAVFISGEHTQRSEEVLNLLSSELVTVREDLKLYEEIGYALCTSLTHIGVSGTVLEQKIFDTLVKELVEDRDYPERYLRLMNGVFGINLGINDIGVVRNEFRIVEFRYFIQNPESSIRIFENYVGQFAELANIRSAWYVVGAFDLLLEAMSAVRAIPEKHRIVMLAIRDLVALKLNSRATMSLLEEELKQLNPASEQYLYLKEIIEMTDSQFSEYFTRLMQSNFE